MVSNRLIQLTKENELNLAKTLAIGIRRSDNIENIYRNKNRIVIITEHFTGTHKIKSVDGKEMIQLEGTYKLNSEKADLEISYQSLSEDTKNKANKVLNPTENSDEKMDNELETKNVENKKKPDKNNTVLSKLYNLIFI